MPMIQQPSNQIKLTNVSIVRLKKGKKRFEIACYKNKVLEYRSGLETNLDEVLQIPNVFINVSKGQTAPSADLGKSFGADKSVDDIVLEILQKGEIQVGEKERGEQLSRLHNEVIDIVAGKLVDPSSKRVYTSGMITKALDQLSATSAHAKQEEAEARKHAGKEEAAAAAAGEDVSAKKEARRETRPLWTGVVTTKSAKMQALDAMKALIAWQPIPVARARMRLRVTCSVSILKQNVKAPASTGAAGSASKGDDDEGGGGTKGKKGGKKGKKAASPTRAPAEVQAMKEDAEGEEKQTPKTVKDKILSFVEEIQFQDEVSGEWEVTGFVEPGAFKPLSEFIANETKGKGRVEVLDMAVVHEDS